MPCGKTSSDTFNNSLLFSAWIQASLAAVIYLCLPRAPQPAASQPCSQVFCEISLAFHFYFCHPTFSCISNTKELLSVLSACALAVLLVGNIPTSYLSKSSLSFQIQIMLNFFHECFHDSHRPVCSSHFSLSLYYLPAWMAPQLAMPFLHSGITHLLNKTIDWKSRVNFPLYFPHNAGSKIRFKNPLINLILTHCTPDQIMSTEIKLSTVNVWQNMIGS